MNDNYGTVCGGKLNQAGDDDDDPNDAASATVGGGSGNVASAEAAIKNAQTALQVAQLSYGSDLNSNLDSAASAHYLNYLWHSEKYLTAQEAYAAGKISQSEYEGAVNKWRQAEADLNDALIDADLEQLGAANDVDQARNDVYQAMERLESLESGATEMGGSLPVNPSGGVLATNPYVARGGIRIAEAALQIMGRAGEHQVAKANTALAHSVHGLAGQLHSVVALGR